MLKMNQKIKQADDGPSSGNGHVAPLCVQTLEQEEKDNEAVSKMMALDQKNQLLNLFHEKNRPTLSKWPQVRTRPSLWNRPGTPPLTHVCFLRTRMFCMWFLCSLWRSGGSSSGLFSLSFFLNSSGEKFRSYSCVCSAGGPLNPPQCLTWGTASCCALMGGSCSPTTPWSVATLSSEFSFPFSVFDQGKTM